MYTVNTERSEYRTSSLGQAIQDAEQAEGETWIFGDNNEEFHWDGENWLEDCAGDLQGNYTPNP